MGWLFSRKKKVPQVPFPEARAPGPDTLRFPERTKERVIVPEEVKSAAGLREEKKFMPDQEEQEMEGLDDSEELPELPPAPRAPAPITSSGEPLYVKVDVYQRILGEIGSLKGYLNELGETNRILENSEYNEEANFDQLRKSMKAMHDRLLQADKIIFKS